MEMKRVVKNVVALSSAAMFLGSTVLGALDLSNYPAPFTENGDFDGLIVVGADAATADVIGAIDIAASLQADTVEEKSVTVEGSVGSSVNVEGGVSLKKDNTALSPFVESIFEYKSGLDEEDLTILERGYLESDSESFDTNYWQSLDFTVASGQYEVKYSTDESDFDDEPTLYVDVADTDVWTYEIDFDTGIDVWGTDGTDGDFRDSEVINMLGKEFFISPNQDADDVLKLTKGADEATVSVDEEVTLNGHSITLLGGTDTGSINIRINGVTKSTSEGETVSVDGESFYIKDVFTQTIPEDSITAVISVGTEEIEFDLTDGTLSLNDDEVEGYTVSSDSATTDDLENLKITFSPEDSELETEYLLEGESIVDPVFEVEVSFEGLTQELDDESKSEIEFSTSSADVKMSFVNAQGNDVDFTYLTADAATTVTNHEDLILSGDSVPDNHYFFLNEDENNAADVTRLLQADDVSTSDGVGYVKLNDETTGTTLELKNGKEVYDTGVYVVGTSSAFTTTDTELDADVAKDTVYLLGSPLSEETSPVTVADGSEGDIYVWESDDGDMIAFEITDASLAGTGVSITTLDGAVEGTGLVDALGTDTLDLSADNTITVDGGTLYSVTAAGAATAVVWTEGGAEVTLDNPTTSDTPSVDIEEDSGSDYIDQFETTNRETFTVEFDDNTGDAEIISVGQTGNGDYGVADDNDMEFGLSAYGTYYELDTDDKDSLKIYYPQVEQNVVAAVGRDVEVSLSGSSTDSTIEYEEVNKIGTGIAMLDSEVTSVAGKNIIAVGGYAANSVAAQFMSAEDLPEAFGEGQALVKLAENGDNVALVVAGYTADDTRLASQVLANYEDYDLSGETVVISGSSLSNVDVVTE